MQAGSDEERPKLIRTILPDKLTGMTAAQAISSALVARARTGEGQHIRLSMLDSVVAFMWSSDMGAQTFLDREVSAQAAATIIDLIYDTKTGYITVSTMTNDQWTGFCRAADSPDLLADERFRTAGGRHRNADERLALIQTVLLTRHRGRVARSPRCTRGFPALRCSRAALPSSTRRCSASGVLVETEHPHAGRLRQARNAAVFEGAPMDIRRGAPLLGEHTAEILDELGYAAAEVASYAADGVVSVSADGSGRRP